MAFIAPLKGVRYNPDLVGKIDDVVTPPYDVINENSVGLFISKTPYSMIRLDITKNPGPSDGSDARYVEAATLFKQWLEKGNKQDFHPPEACRSRAPRASDRASAPVPCRRSRAHCGPDW